MNKSFKLQDGMVITYDDNGAELEKESIIDLLESEFDLVTQLKSVLLEYVNTHNYPKAKEDVRKSISDKLLKEFTASFKEGEEFGDNELYKFVRSIEKEFKKMSDDLHKEVTELISKKINNVKKVNGGEEMFKSVKEAKSFTAHLDALANEIQELGGVSNEMRSHLAYRIDRLSDVIEKTAFEKEANGVGTGAWVHDADEARYMGTMGGTGTLEGDSDESHYMKHFKGDDHKEVLERKETMEIKEGGPKKKQPSDDYKEGEVARRLKATVQKVIKSLDK